MSRGLIKKEVFVLFCILSTIINCYSSFCVVFVDDPGGTYCIKDDNTEAKNEWIEFDYNDDGIKEYFYFGDDYYLVKNKYTSDGYKVDENGIWDGEEAIEVSDNIVVMPSDTESAKKKKTEVYGSKFNRAQKEYIKTRDTEKFIRDQHNLRNSYAKPENSTSYDFVIEKQDMLKKINDLKLKLLEKTEQLESAIKSNESQEIIETLYDVINLYNDRIKMLEDEYKMKYNG